MALTLVQSTPTPYATRESLGWCKGVMTDGSGDNSAVMMTVAHTLLANLYTLLASLHGLVIIEFVFSRTLSLVG